MDTIYVRSLLEKCWSDETAITNGLITIRQDGQCLTTALLVQELFGGYVLVARARGESHYLNEVDGTFVDLAADHEMEFPEAVRLDRPELLKHVPKVGVALKCCGRGSRAS